MSCRERQQQLQDYLAGELAPDARKDLKAHLEACSSCREDLAAYRLLLGALPSLPEPAVPADLPGQIVAALRSYRAACRPERETATATLIRRTVLVVFASAFAVTLGAALWGWATRITGFAARSFSRDLLAFWDAAKDLWSLLRLFAEVAGMLQPVAQNLWAILLRAGEPLAPLGPIILAIYASALLLGTLLCWRAFSCKGERRLSHAS